VSVQRPAAAASDSREILVRVLAPDHERDAFPTPTSGYPPTEAVTRRVAARAETARANRSWWDSAADAYQEEHGAFLGDERFTWGPEGIDEADVRLLGDVRGRRILEVGAGAAQCSRWLAGQGAEPVALELSSGQLRHARRLNTVVGCPLVQADAARLPFADLSFDIVCSAYGAYPFLADLALAFAEAARVLRPGGRLVFSVSHPMRWCFLDDPDEGGLVAVHSYFDRRAYVEQDSRGRATYVEHHRTMGDWIRALVGAGLRVIELVEPEWPDDNPQTWGGWSPLRGKILPGTAIFVAEKLASVD
jgi:ubiquinone/menaquinone biosynthesis C-methylase UbiE